MSEETRAKACDLLGWVRNYSRPPRAQEIVDALTAHILDEVELAKIVKITQEEDAPPIESSIHPGAAATRMSKKEFCIVRENLNLMMPRRDTDILAMVQEASRAREAEGWLHGVLQSNSADLREAGKRIAQLEREVDGARNRVSVLETENDGWRNRVEQADIRIAELERGNADYHNAWKSCMDESCDRFEKHCTCVPALRARVRELEETHASQLAGISTASIQNTRKSVAERIDKTNPYWTQGYGDVCRAVDREIELREQLATARVLLEDVVGHHDNANWGVRNPCGCTACKSARAFLGGEESDNA